MTKWKKWGPVAAWMALIFILSGQSQLPSPDQRWLDTLFEKGGHGLEFAILAALLARALDPIKIRRWQAFALVILVTWLYALLDEFHQSFVPGREADWSDIFADWLGAVVGVSVWLFVWSARHDDTLPEET